MSRPFSSINDSTSVLPIPLDVWRNTYFRRQTRRLSDWGGDDQEYVGAPVSPASPGLLDSEGLRDWSPPREMSLTMTAPTGGPVPRSVASASTPSPSTASSWLPWLIVGGAGLLMLSAFRRR